MGLGYVWVFRPEMGRGRSASTSSHRAYISLFIALIKLVK